MDEQQENNGPRQLYEPVDEQTGQVAPQPIARKFVGKEALRAWMKLELTREQAAAYLQGYGVGDTVLKDAYSGANGHPCLFLLFPLGLNRGHF